VLFEVVLVLFEVVLVLLLVEVLHVLGAVGRGPCRMRAGRGRQRHLHRA
jgi:hypothetical protein